MVGKFKLKDALEYSKLKNQMKNGNKKQQARAPKKPVQKVEEDESESEEEEEEEEEETKIDIEHPISKKDMRKLKKELKKKGKTLEDVLPKEEEEEEEEEEETVPKLIDTNKLVESDSESEIEDNNEEDDEEEEEEEEEDVALSDAEFDEDADVIPFQKLTVNNKQALQQALHAIQLPRGSGLKFNEHLSVTSAEALAPQIRDVFDDLERELGFYKQGLAAVELARTQLRREKVAFSRPTDYFAEMIKSDEHMDKLKAKLIADETAKRAQQDARKLRELKKFGKQVQHAKLQERAKEKRATLDKIQGLKRKRAGNEMTSEDFDIAVEEAAAANEERGGQRGGKFNAKRKAKDQRYGFGGKKKFQKSNDAASSGDVSDFNRRMKSKRAGGSGGSAPKGKRPGKSRRQQGRR